MYRKAYLMLGDKCNFHCKYCLQQNHLTLPEEERINENIFDFLLREAKQVKNDKFHIQYWGGEPLIYWDKIKEITDRLAPAGLFTFGIISNGSLLSQDKVDYVNEHGMYFCLSHDGKSTEYTRGRNLLKDKDFMWLFRQIIRRAVLAVISRQNNNLQETMEYFDRYEINQYNFDPLLETIDMPPEIYDIDLKEFGKSVDIVMENLYLSYIQNISTWDSNYCMDMISRLKFYLDNPTHEANDYPPCNNTYNVINIDLFGNVYVCHNSSIKIGTIYESDEVIKGRFQKYNIYNRSEECRACPCFPVCRGGCILIPPGEKKKRYCEVQKIMIGKLYATLQKIGKYGGGR